MSAADKPPYRTFNIRTIPIYELAISIDPALHCITQRKPSVFSRTAQPTLVTLNVGRSSLSHLPPFLLLPASTSSSSLMITIVCQTPSRIRGGQTCESGKQARRLVLALVDKSYELCFSNWTWSKLRSPNLESRRLALWFVCGQGHVEQCIIVALKGTHGA